MRNLGFHGPTTATDNELVTCPVYSDVLTAMMYEFLSAFALH